MQPKYLPKAQQPYYSENDIFATEDNCFVYISSHESCEVGMHCHEFYELNVITAGNGCHYIEKMSMPVSPGDVFVLPPNTLHGYWSEGNFTVSHIILKGDFLDNNYSMLSTSVGFSKLFKLEPHLRQVYNKNLFLHLSESRLEKVKNTISRIAYLNSQNRKIQAGYTTLDLICQLSYYMDNDTDTKLCDNPNLYGILKALEYIHDNYGEKLTTEKLASVSKTSVASFNRHFKQIMKQPPMQYIITYRVNVAKKMLDENLYSKTEIAQKCGFYDISHMEKYLKLNP